MQKLRIACIGEAMVEISVKSIPGTAQLGVAGDVLNTAIYLRRQLPPAHEVSFVSLLGTDRLSNDIVQFIANEGILTDSIGRIGERLPGAYAISTDAQGERQFLYWRENSAARLMFQQDSHRPFAALEDFDVIYFSAITLAILPDEVRLALLHWLEAYRVQGGKLVFDSNYRPKLWHSIEAAQTITQMAWQLCDIALPSVDDEMGLFGDSDASAVLARFKTYSQCKGALKCGANGPLAINQTVAPQAYLPAENVVDTTAAGDGFNAGYLAGILIGEDAAQSMSRGHELSRRIVASRGAILPR